MTDIERWTLRYVGTTTGTSQMNAVVDGPVVRWSGEDVEVVRASDYRGAVALLRQARGYVADHAAAHPADQMAAKLWTQIDAAIDAAGGQ